MLREHKQRLTTHLLRFWHAQQGAILIFFALSVPVALGFGALAIDGAHVLNSRVRLSQAADEAAIAISAIHNKNASATDKTSNEELAKQYTLFYTGNHGDISNIHVKFSEANSTYYVTSTYETKNLLASHKLAGLEDKMTTGNDRLSSGIISKIGGELIDTDITLVVDMSTSMLCDYDTSMHSPINSCQSYPQIPGYTTINPNSRAGVLRKIVSDLVNTYANIQEVQFALVPFDFGVPFRPQDSIHLKHLPTTNELGGEQIGCSIPYQIQSPFDEIDFNFWANKGAIYQTVYSKIDRLNNNTRDRILAKIDYHRYLYYRYVIGPTLGLNSDQALVNAGYCIDNGARTNILDGKYRYSCEKDPTNSIFTANNLQKIDQQYNYLVDWMMMNKGALNWVGTTSLLKYEFIDTNTVLQPVDDNSITEFYQPTAPHTATQRMFSEMCSSAQGGAHQNSLLGVNYAGISGNYNGYQSSYPAVLEFYQRASNQISTSKAQTYLMPMTQNSLEKQQIVTKFNNMTFGGGSDPMSGLLRASHLAAQSTALKKIIIVISDGVSNLQHNTGWGLNTSLTDFYLGKGQCQAIRQQLDQITKQQHGLSTLDTPSEIHFVSLTPGLGYGLWIYCADFDMSFLHPADDISGLIKMIEANKTTGNSSETGFMRPKN